VDIRRKPAVFRTAAKMIGREYRAEESTAKYRDAGQIQERTQLEPLTTGLGDCHH